MGKLAVLMIIVLTGAIALFSIANTEVTSVAVPFDRTYEITKVNLMLLSLLTGAVTVFILFVVRDTQRYFVAYQFKKKKRREDKLARFYSTAVDAILANDDADAREALEEILRLDPENINALLRLGDIEKKKGRNAEAVDCYHRALLYRPSHMEALFSLEDAMERLGRWREAEEYVERILAVDDNNLSALYRKRLLQERKGHWDDVIDTQKAIIKTTEKDSAERAREEARMLGFRYELGREGLESGSFEKAAKGFKSLIRDDPDFIPAYLGVAESMVGLNEQEDAVSFLEKSYEQTRSLIVLARLEDLLISLGEPGRLITAYRRAIAAQPESALLKFFLAKLYFRLEMIEDSFEILLAMEMEPYPAEYYNLLGALYLRRNECVKAVEQFKKSVEMKKTLRLPYCCGVCKHSAREWSGRCPECGSWNSYGFDVDGVCKL